VLQNLTEMLFALVADPVALRRQVAEAADLRDLRVEPQGTVTGRDGALTVSFSASQRRSASHEVAVRGLFLGLAIERAGLGSRFWETVGVRDVEVGDPAFDADLTLRAIPRLPAFALLDAETRALIRSVFLTGEGAALSSGVLSAQFVKHFGGPQLFTVETVRALLALGHRLRAPAEPEARLAAIAAGDPLSGVRAKALATLVEEAPQRPETRAALLAGTRDAVPAIRLQAARALGSAGEPALHALASDASIEDAVSAGAITALGPRFDRVQARSILSRAVRVGRLETAIATVRVLATDGAAEVPAIAEVLALTHGSIAVAAAEALGAIGASSGEAALIEALRRHEPSVAAAAAHALGRCGTAASVPDLKDAEGRRDDVSRAARTAVAAIRSRLVGASPGQVSLAGGGAGQLSVADAADGRVSLEADE
jgi:hypothetical protein